MAHKKERKQFIHIPYTPFINHTKNDVANDIENEPS